MDYTVTKGKLNVMETVFDGCAEQPVDLDFSLPDYCPDMQRILKCQVKPQIHMYNISGDQLELEGNVIVKVLYLDTVKQMVRCFEHVNQFSTALTLKKAPNNAMDAIVFMKPRVEYINCRAVSSRKLDIHGAFSICAKVLCKTEQEFVSSIPAEGMEEKKKEIPVSDIVAAAQQIFSVSEVLEIGQGKPEAETIIRSDITAVMHDYKTVANKLIVKGEALVKVLYTGNVDDGEMETMEYSIPVSQIIDAPGIADNSVCDVALDVLNYDVQVRTDSSGEDALLAVDIKMVAAVIAYADSNVTVVTDAYSTQYDLELDYKTLSFERLLEFVKDTYVYKNTIEINDSSITRVIDVWNEISTVTAQQENNQIVFKGKFNICILSMNENNEPLYIEKMIDFDYAHDWSGNPSDVRCSGDVTVASLSYRITGSGGIEIRAELGLHTPVYAESNDKAVCFASADESKPRVKDTSAALILYYADQGENIWNIARTYCTSAEAIKQENDLSDDILESRAMLLIPM